MQSAFQALNLQTMNPPAARAAPRGVGPAKGEQMRAAKACSCTCSKASGQGAATGCCTRQGTANSTCTSSTRAAAAFSTSSWATWHGQAWKGERQEVERRHQVSEKLFAERLGS